MTTGLVHTWIHDAGSSGEEQEQGTTRNGFPPIAGRPTTFGGRNLTWKIWLVLLEVAPTRLVVEILRADFQVDRPEQSSRHPPLRLPGPSFLSATT